MNNKIPISLTIYSTTKGHYGNDTLETTIKHLNKKFLIEEFGCAYCHLKVSTGHEEKSLKITKDNKKYGIKTISTIKDWNRQDNNMAEAYFLDMYRLMSENDIHSNPYVFFLEDDWLINTDFDLNFYFSEAIKLLKKDSTMLAVRINNEEHSDTSKSVKINNTFFLQGKNYTQYGPTLTFQPTIMRTRDWYATVRFINKNWYVFKDQHCELVSGNVMRYLFADNPTPFAFFNPDKVNCKHIGTKDFGNE